MKSKTKCLSWVMLSIFLGFALTSVTTGWAQSQSQTMEAAPTEAAPTEAVPTEAVPTEAVPTEAVPTEEASTEAVPTEAAPAPAPAAPKTAPKSLSEAIDQGLEEGFLKAEDPKGYLGIPGAPSPSWILAFLWAVWVGWIFSTVGAFGGIMAGVGHLTVFGLGDYARSFKDTSPFLNKLVTDSIRVSNQFLVGLSAVLSTFNYWKMGRIVLPLGIALGLGSIVGATAIPWLTAGKIKLSQYQGYFGIVVFIIGGILIYEMTPRGQASKKAAREAAQAFEKSIKEKKSDVEMAASGVRLVKFSATRVIFTFFGTEFTFNPWIAIAGGIVISAISSFIGVGGGFLYVPFLTSVVGLPMYIVAGTSALAVLLSMITSIINYLFAGALVSWGLVGTELVGIVVGSMIGPRTSKYIPEKGLKWLFIVLAFYVGLRYFSKGFFGTSWVPPY
ncbi:MAG: TSUP family transporter [Thermodesulfobacteriota bacterium]|nr:TSUP family transporter [Thermodesulfobacteriota bacterium]